MIAGFVIEPLSAAHDRQRFQCGHTKIDRYFHQIVTQDVRRNYATCYVGVDTATQRVAGFYTLSAHSIPLSDMPSEFTRKLPAYPNVPAVLIGWLGIDRDFQGRRLGSMLLVDAISRVAHASIGAHAIFADAINDEAVSFYERFGFLRFKTKPTSLFMPISAAVRRLPE